MEQEINNAQHLVREILTDISLYNYIKIREGIQQGDLYDRLKDIIDEGKRLFQSRTNADPKIYDDAVQTFLTIKNLLGAAETVFFQFYRIQQLSVAEDPNKSMASLIRTRNMMGRLGAVLDSLESLLIEGLI